MYVELPASLISFLTDAVVPRPEPTPVPYKPGARLNLQILERYDENSPRPLPSSTVFGAFLGKPFEITMSPVMRVTIFGGPNGTTNAILKLYDRRFGPHLRDVGGKYSPHTASDEQALASFVEHSQIEGFLRELRHKKETALIQQRSWHLLDSTPQGIAKFEAALWQEANDMFDCETKAYSRLKNLQGEKIPRILAHVSWEPPASEESQESLRGTYTTVKGLLIETIPGCSLWDLPVSPNSPDPDEWTSIVQRAMDTVHEINTMGIVMNDCSPRNVVVHRESHAPFIIDLAQCTFKDEMIQRWLDDAEADPQDDEESDPEDDDWDPEVEYWEIVSSNNDTWAIGGVMMMRLRNTKGIEINVEVPDYDKIIEGIKADKKRQG